MFISQAKTNWKFLIIIITLAVIVAMGIFYWQNKINTEKNISGIKVGPVKITQDFIKEIQSSVDEGHQPWRLNPIMVLRSEMANYGFDPENDFAIEDVSTSTQAEFGKSITEISFDVDHDSQTYSVILIQPIAGPDKIWVISEIELKNDQTSDWQTYRNEEYGFEVKYPQDWKFNDGGKIIDFCGPEYWQTNGDCKLSGKGSASAISLRNDSLDIAKEGFCLEHSANIFCGQITSRQDILIGGKPGQIFSFENINNGYQVALWKKNTIDINMYELSADELKNYPSHKNIFNQMLSTFRFIE